MPEERISENKRVADLLMHELSKAMIAYIDGDCSDEEFLLKLREILKPHNLL